MSDADAPLLSPEAEAAIIAGIRDHKRSFAYGGYGMFAFAALMAPVVWFTGTQGSPLGRTIACTLILGGVGLPFVLLSLGDPARHKTLELLRSRPADSIVWLYQFSTGKRAAGVTVNVGFDDGTQGGVTVPYEHAAAVWDALVARAPQATQGFNEQLARQYRENPGSLRAG